MNIGGGGAPSHESLKGRYDRARKLVSEQNLDAAYAEFKDLANASNGDVAKDAKARLDEVNTMLYNLPRTPLTQILAHSGDFIEKIAGVQGTYVPGGQTGEASEYFWIKSEGKAVQVNYSHMTLDDKKRILATAEGAPILVRGRVKPPWSNRAKPYLELVVFWVLGAPQ